MFYRRSKEPIPRDGIYLAILGLLVVNVVAGVALMLLGGELWDNPEISRAGAWLAGITGLLYIFFRWFGIREARRKARVKEEPSKE